MKNKALYWEKVDKGVRCLLCPFYCVIKEGYAGLCQVRKNEGGDLVSLTDGIVLAEGYDPIEKKPLYYFHPGQMIYSIGTAGCNFHCDFCQNWQLAKTAKAHKDYWVSNEEIIERAKRKNSIGIAFTYNEPTLNFEMMVRLARKAKGEGLVTVAVSNGYLNEEPMRELSEVIDGWNIDFKMPNPRLYKKICGGDPKVVLRNIAIAKELGHVEVTSLLIDGVNTSDEDLKSTAKSIAAISPEIPLHFTRYFPAYKRQDLPTRLETLVRAKKIGDRYLKKVRLGNV